MTAPTIPAPANAAAASEAAPVVPATPVPPVAPQIKRAADILSGSNEDLLTRFGLTEQVATAEPTETDEAPTAASTVAEVVAETAAEPPAETPKPDETVATPEKPKPERQLATQFKVLDASGAEQEIPDLKITFTANGKERSEPLDKVVRLAQSGFYNEEREQQVLQTRAQFSTLQTENQSLKSQVETVRAELLQMLADPTDARYQALKAEHAQHNTPEARAARAEQALLRERETYSTQRAAEQAQIFTSVLDQHFGALRTQYPEVSLEEMTGRFGMLTAPHQRNGRVPPEAFNTIATLVDNELTPWVQQRHEAKVQEKVQRERDAQEKIDREKAAATTARVQAKRTIARAIPGSAGTVTTPIRETPQAPKYKKADDILGDVGRIVATAPG